MCMFGVQQRLKWIDAMRGLAILLVVLGHSIGSITDPMNRFILSFHMPVFFFISGLVINCRYKNGELIPLKSFAIKKANAILIPQLVLFIINTFFDVIVEHKTITLNLFLTNIFNWFLVVLFYITLLYWAIDKTRLIDNRFILIVLFLCLAIVTQVSQIKTVAHIETIPMAMLFLLLGHYYREQNNIHPFKNYTQMLSHFWLMAIPVIVICSYWNRPVTMYENSYGNMFLFGITSLCGIWVCYEVGISLEKNKILQWFGKKSRG